VTGPGRKEAHMDEDAEKILVEWLGG